MAGSKPFGAYAGFAAVFGSALAAFIAAEGKRLPERPRLTDTLLIGVATHKLARLIAKDDVTSFLRAPVTVDEEGTDPKPRGIQRAAGELVTCPYCLGLWISAGLSAANVLWPSRARFVVSVLAAHGCADLLHAGFTRLRAESE
jgi:hypothetical protein